MDPATLEDVRGHRLPMREPGAPAARGRVLLVGDAAGLVDPLSGDGMYEAFVSARLAAMRSSRAGRRVRGEPCGALDHHAAASWKAKRVADRYPGACLLGASSARVSSEPSRAFCAATSHIPSEARGLARPPLRALSRLARHVTPQG